MTFAAIQQDETFWAVTEQDQVIFDHPEAIFLSSLTEEEALEEMILKLREEYDKGFPEGLTRVSRQGPGAFVANALSGAIATTNDFEVAVNAVQVGESITVTYIGDDEDDDDITRSYDGYQTLKSFLPKHLWAIYDKQPITEIAIDQSINRSIRIGDIPLINDCVISSVYFNAARVRRLTHEDWLKAVKRFCIKKTKSLQYASVRWLLAQLCQSFADAVKDSRDIVFTKLSIKKVSQKDSIKACFFLEEMAKKAKIKIALPEAARCRCEIMSKAKMDDNFRRLLKKLARKPKTK